MITLISMDQQYFESIVKKSYTTLPVAKYYSLIYNRGHELTVDQITILLFSIVKWNLHRSDVPDVLSLFSIIQNIKLNKTHTNIIIDYLYNNKGNDHCFFL